LNPDFGDIPIIDTHEHLAKVYHWRPEVVGLLHFVLENHYLMAGVAAGDSKCAGRDWMDEGATPYWALTKAEGVVPAADEEAGMAYIIERLPTVALTSDWKAFEITLRELYGLDGFLVTRENWRALDTQVRRRYKARDQWYREVLARAGIRLVFWCYGKPLLDGCRGVLNAMDFLHQAKDDTRDSEALAARFEAWLDGEIASYNPVSMKIGFAYYRDVAVARRPHREVDAALRALSPEKALTESRTVDDFVHELAARVAPARGLALQVHTGTLAGNVFEQPLLETYAARLEPFIARHPDANFDVFHGSFPQWGEAVTLARKYPNVYLNMCWVTGLSESMAEAMLTAAFDAVPVNKIMWGGDAHSPEMAYGLAALFRDILARALARRGLSAKLKRDAAEWVLWRSAATLYRLPAP